MCLRADPIPPECPQIQFLRYVFAGIPEELDLRDIDGIRKWFIASLTGMGNLLDLITESPALTGTTE